MLYIFLSTNRDYSCKYIYDSMKKSMGVCECIADIAD